MSTNYALKARNVLLVFQVLAALIVVFATIIALFGSKEIKSFEDINSIRNVENFFGAVMTARIGAIITFSASIISAIISYFCNFNIGKYIGEAVCSTGMFIINFILAPFSSAENLVGSLTNSIINSLHNYGNQVSRSASTNPIAAPLIILLILAIIEFFLSIRSINDSPKKRRSTLVKRTLEDETGKNSSGTKKCSFCGATMPNEALICKICGKTYIPPVEPHQEKIGTCKFCGAVLSPGASIYPNSLICWNCKKTYQPSVAPTKSETKTCSFCGATISADGEFCGKCGKQINHPEPPQKAKTCVFCGAEIPIGNKFCGICGKPVSTEKTCQNCGAKIPLGNSFCGKCGTKINLD